MKTMITAKLSTLLTAIQKIRELTYFVFPSPWLIPLFVIALDGNSSDKKVLIKTIKELTQNLNLDERVYHVADSAFYTEDNVKEIGTTLFSFREYLQPSMKQRNNWRQI